MNQKKTGEFLKHLRKDRGLTQEQLAEHFYISSRTVSRWETGSNMPDVDMLIELADFYDVDIREIIDGERKGETMDLETKDTIKKVVQYAEEEKKRLRKKVSTISLVICAALMACVILFASETKGLLNGIVPNHTCDLIMGGCLVISIITIGMVLFFNYGGYDKYLERRKKRNKGTHGSSADGEGNGIDR